jgi:hypothetical protein
VSDGGGSAVGLPGEGALGLGGFDEPVAAGLGPRFDVGELVVFEAGWGDGVAAVPDAEEGADVGDEVAAGEVGAEAGAVELGGEGGAEVVVVDADELLGVVHRSSAWSRRRSPASGPPPMTRS